MADRTSVPVLTLDSLIDRPVVVINGSEYELMTRGGLPPLDVARLAKYSRRVEALIEKSQTEDLKATEEKELEVLPDKICRLILMAPDAVQKKLTDKQRMDITATFLTAPWWMGRNTAPTETPTTTPSAPNGTGEKSSPASSPATAATR
jgi:hypothetical protein